MISVRKIWTKHLWGGWSWAGALREQESRPWEHVGEEPFGEGPASVEALRWAHLEDPWGWSRTSKSRAGCKEVRGGTRHSHVDCAEVMGSHYRDVSRRVSRLKFNPTVKFAQGHPARKWQTQDLSLSSLGARAQALNHHSLAGISRADSQNRNLLSLDGSHFQSVCPLFKRESGHIMHAQHKRVRSVESRAHKKPLLSFSL